MPYEKPTRRDPFTSLIINDTSYRRFYRQPVAVNSATFSAASFTRSPAFLREKARTREDPRETVWGPQEGKEGIDRNGGRKGGNERREWIGELEQRKLITCPVAFSWLDYLVTAERGERPGDWSSQERSFADAIFDFARPNGPEKFNVTGCLIEQRWKCVLFKRYFILHC